MVLSVARPLPNQALQLLNARSSGRRNHRGTEAGWAGIKNGELLRIAAGNVEAFVTWLLFDRLDRDRCCESVANHPNAVAVSGAGPPRTTGRLLRIFPLQ
jgi:hypothetical protein